MGGKCVSLQFWRRAGEETRALSLGHCVSLNKTLQAQEQWNADNGSSISGGARTLQ